MNDDHLQKKRPRRLSGAQQKVGRFAESCRQELIPDYPSYQGTRGISHQVISRYPQEEIKARGRTIRAYSNSPTARRPVLIWAHSDSSLGVRIERIQEGKPSGKERGNDRSQKGL